MSTPNLNADFNPSTTPYSWDALNKSSKSINSGSSNPSFKSRQVHTEKASDLKVISESCSQTDESKFCEREVKPFMACTSTQTWIEDERASKAMTPTTAAVTKSSKVNEGKPSQTSRLLSDHSSNINTIRDNTSINLDKFVQKLANSAKIIFSINSGVDHEKLVAKLTSGQMNDLIRHLAKHYSIDQNTFEVAKVTTGSVNPERIRFTDKSFRENISDINPAIIIITALILVTVLVSAVLDVTQDDPSNLFFQRSGAVGIVWTLLFGYFSVFKNKAAREAYKAVIDDIDTKLIKGETITLTYVLKNFHELEERHLAANRSTSRKEIIALAAGIFFTLVWGYGDKAIS
ncbi:hypothetical protein [uncultured Endozoicomonas sp.]|uniref:hypothetical protein n=1 Tax=uncultured Endozoicomonas sp. TaxID=432652 RepID=UPI00262BC1F1|nr:hypothetical protein [uncultured Endozoicomonas sp.]